MLMDLTTSTRCYLTEEEYINEMSEEAGQLVGLGLTLSEDESGYVRIDGILQDSPLYNSGLQEGDIITFVDGVDVLQAGFDDSVEAMRGTEGSQIVLTVRRDGVDTDYTFYASGDRGHDRYGRNA